jgi:predicted GNAT family N-acyltransferase
MKAELITNSDIPAVIEVIKDSFLCSVAPDWSEDAVKAFLEEDLSVLKLSRYLSENNICLKAVEGSEIIGVLIFSSKSKLAYLFVTPSQYNKGVGKNLFSTAIPKVQDEVEYITLTSSEFAVKAYEKIGFKKSALAFKYNGCIFQPMVYWLGQHRLAGKVEFIR